MQNLKIWRTVSFIYNSNSRLDMDFSSGNYRALTIVNETAHYFCDSILRYCFGVMPFSFLKILVKYVTSGIPQELAISWT